MKRMRGFTLIEILIVVVILAVLAAMILPRFVSQSENAYIAEAQQQLGVLRRGIANYMDTNNVTSITALSSANTLVAASMSPLGLQQLTQTNFQYVCASTGTCTAYRVGTTTNNIALTVDGTFTCTGYTAVSGNKGCRAA